MNPEQYIKIRDRLFAKIAKCHTELFEARSKADECKIPPNLRHAVPKDIVVDAVIWYPEVVLDLKCGVYGSPAHWCIVDEVLCPRDVSKAYIHDGCRYGLANAYVEIKPTVV